MISCCQALISNMKVVFLLVLAVTLVSTGAVGAKVRGCYVTNWSQYRAEPGKWSMNKYEPGVCTHIWYAFAQSDANGNAKSTDASDEAGLYAQLQALKAKQPGLKTILSFGGGTYRDFPTVARNPQLYAQSVVQFAKKYGFDGVDIDWEFPTAAEKELFTSLLRAVKQAGGSGFLVTAAVSPNAGTAAQIYDLPALKDSLDYLNIMAYDFHGSWELQTGVNAPLYGEGMFTVDYLTQFYLRSFPAEKVLLGIPTYGHGWTLSSAAPGQGLGSPAIAASIPLPASGSKGDAAYYEVCQLLQQGGRKSWDEKSKTPFIQKDNQFISYDDEQSVAQKASYAMQKNLGGVFTWTLDFDDISNTCQKGKFPLMNAIKKVLA